MLRKKMERSNTGIRDSQGKGYGKASSTGLLCSMGKGKETLGWGILRGSGEVTLVIGQYLLWH